MTYYKIEGNNFLINDKLTYSELPGSSEKAHGLLFNARFIQGVFEDITPENKFIYNRFNKEFDKDQNTQDLIDALPQWYNAGLRAITVGLQGGGPVYSFPDWSVINTNAFSKDGKEIEKGHKERLLKIIEAADKIGMLVIVSVLYEGQAHLLKDDHSLSCAIRSTCEFLEKSSFKNIIIEVVNEHDVGRFNKHPLIYTHESITHLIYMCKEWCNSKFAVGCSCIGGGWSKDIVEASDIVLIHGNGLDREGYSRMIKSVKEICGDSKPIVCNEDSQRISQLQVCIDTHTSWGYYNNFTKQEPPTDWSIMQGEDEFFSKRLSDIIYNTKANENEYFLHGFEKGLDINSKHFVRLASRYPEKINYVKFYEDEKLLDISYCEPFMYKSLTSWNQIPYEASKKSKKFTAEVTLHNGKILKFIESLNN